MIDVALKLGAAADGIDINKVKMDIYDRLSAYYGTSLNKIKMSKALHDIIMLLKQNNLRVSPNFVLLAKATVTTESLAYNLDPSLNFVKVARPFVKRLAKERLKPQQIAERARRKVDAMFSFAESIPKKTADFLADLHDTSRDLRRIDKDLNTLAVELDRSSNRVTLGFLAGTLMIASTLLLPFQKPSGMGIPPLSLTGYIIALFVLLVIFISILREKKI
jgi:ubiquinone biosynthesis protein